MKPIPQYNAKWLQRMFRKDEAQQDYFFVREDAFSLYDFEPFRTETYAIAFLRKGAFVLHGGLERIPLVGPCLFAMGPHVIRQFEKGAHDPLLLEPPQLDIVFFTSQFFLDGQPDVFFLSKFTFFEENQAYAFELDGCQEERLTILYEQIRGLLAEKHPYEAPIIKSYINILIHEADVIFKKVADKHPEAHGASSLTARFKSLLVRDFKTERSVGYYADQLNVTAKYLSEFLKEKTGRSASQWINEAIILEAKVLLQRSDYSVAQVSELLNFSDQSVFGKFFKANTDLSPASYKKSIA